MPFALTSLPAAEEPCLPAARAQIYGKCMKIRDTVVEVKAVSRGRKTQSLRALENHLNPEASGPFTESAAC